MRVYRARVRITEIHNIVVMADDTTEALVKAKVLTAEQVRAAVHDGKSLHPKVSVRSVKPSPNIVVEAAAFERVAREWRKSR